MNLDEIRQLVVGSHADDWHVISCHGPEGGPSFLESRLDGEQHFHTRRAVLRADVAVGLAWGLYVDERASSSPPWLSPHWNNTYQLSGVLDTFYCGALIDRDDYVVVDSGRASLPRPRSEAVAETLHSEGISDWVITRRQYGLFSLLEELDGGAPRGELLDDYLFQAGFRLEGGGEPWMS